MPAYLGARLIYITCGCGEKGVTYDEVHTKSLLRNYDFNSSYQSYM